MEARRRSFSSLSLPDRGPDPAPHAPARVAVPPGAVDTHAHIVGDTFVPERSYTPPPASTEDYLHMLDATGMTYGVLVQVSVHGTDNSLLVEALRAHPGRLRGVAVTPPDISDRALAELKDAGVTGLRLNTVTGGGIGLDQLDRLEPVCAELGWHLQFLTPSSPSAASSARPAGARSATRAAWPPHSCRVTAMGRCG
jgi:2-pyrone-4,6-dicarboxylate lactonase